MGQILVFAPQSGEVALVERILLIAMGNGAQIQQSGLSHEDGLHLEEVVAVLAHGLQGHVVGPLLESLAVDAEAVVAGQRHEVGIFPRAVAALGTLADGLGLLFQPLGLQGGHPGMHGQAAQRGNQLIAGGIVVGVEQLLVIGFDSGRNLKLQLWQVFATRVLHVAVGHAHHMEHHIVVSRIVVVPVLVPVAGTVVNLHIAHPQRAVDLQLCVEEVGPGIPAVMESGIHYLDAPAISSLQGAQWPQLVFPDVV